MSAPLYDLLKAVAAEDLLRLDMPGHHGGPLPVETLADTALDFTENGRTGDLFGDGEDAVLQAERLWAQRFGFESCLFLTGGSTQGNHTALALLAGTGSHAAIDRGSHRSVYHALALLDLTPHYLTRPWLTEEGIAGPITAEAVENLLKNRRDIKTVCITSPTYYGVLSDIPAISSVCHRYGAKLMVDAAHGAHLPFLGYEGYRAADGVVMSAHKTLPALGQTALLFANGYDMDELKRFGSVYGSSSPSYLMMASLDLARDWMEREGCARYRETAALVEDLRLRFGGLCSRSLALDPTRLVIPCGDGFALEQGLRQRNILPEMADRGHVVFIFTAADGPEQARRLADALEELLPSLPSPEAGEDLSPPPVPRQVLSPRQALFAPRQALSPADSEGRVAACQIAPYPPGIPVIAPGERIEKKHLAYLKRIGYNIERDFVIRDL